MNCPFSKFKGILGIPNEGVHKYRFLGTAIIDYIMTIIASCITTYYSKMPLPLTTIIWFVVSIILHALFGIETGTIKYLGFSCNKEN